MTYLIVGGLGFIGYNLAKELIKDNNEVIVIDNISYDSYYPYDLNLKKMKKKHFIANDNYTFYKKNICTDSLDDVFDRKIDYIIFLADMTHDYYSILKNDFTLLNIGLKKIIKYVQKKNIKFILGSSSWIYDKTNKKVLKEEIIKDNLTDYGRAIRVNEEIILNSKIKAIILRLGIVYGDGMLPNNFLYEILDKLYSGERLLGYEYDVEVPKDYIHIKDVIYCIKKSFDYFDHINSTEIINVGSAKCTSTNTLINNIVLYLNSRFKNYGYKIDEYNFPLKKTDYMRLNINKAKENLGFPPSTDIEVGIIDLINYYESINYVNTKLTKKLKIKIDKMNYSELKKEAYKYLKCSLTNGEVINYIDYKIYMQYYSLNDISTNKIMDLSNTELLELKEDLMHRNYKKVENNFHLFNRKVYETSNDSKKVIDFIDKILGVIDA